MDKLKLTGQNLDWVFGSRSVCMYAMHVGGTESKLSNFKLKTQPKQLLGSLPLDIALPCSTHFNNIGQGKATEKMYPISPLFSRW